VRVEHGSKARPLALGQDISRRALQPHPCANRRLAHRKPPRRLAGRKTDLDGGYRTAVKVQIQRLAHPILLSVKQQQ